MLERPCEYGVYSLQLKQRLLDALQLDREEKRAARDLADTSSGLASRLNKVRKLTGDGGLGWDRMEKRAARDLADTSSGLASRLNKVP